MVKISKTKHVTKHGTVKKNPNKKYNLVILNYKTWEVTFTNFNHPTMPIEDFLTDKLGLDLDDITWMWSQTLKVKRR